MLNVVKQFAQSQQNGLFINSCFAHCQTERQDTWFADNSPVLHNRVSAISLLIFDFSLAIYWTSLHIPDIYRQNFPNELFAFKINPHRNRPNSGLSFYDFKLGNNTCSKDISGFCYASFALKTYCPFEINILHFFIFCFWFSHESEKCLSWIIMIILCYTFCHSDTVVIHYIFAL